MKLPSRGPLLAEALLTFGVFAFSMVVFAIAIQPWPALIEVLHGSSRSNR